MTRLEALIELRDTLMEGDWLAFGDEDYSRVLIHDAGLLEEATHIHGAWTGSFDAFKVLKDSLLPEFSIETRYRPWGAKPSVWHVILSDDHTGYGSGTYAREYHTILSKACLGALLNVLITLEHRT
jgi:hypothetical protein